jgi:hypothetical protein
LAEQLATSKIGADALPNFSQQPQADRFQGEALPATSTVNFA